MLFKRIDPKRPSVIRRGNRVETCFLYKGMKECLGAQCLWPRVGTCAVFTRKFKRARAK